MRLSNKKRIQTEEFLKKMKEVSLKKHRYMESVWYWLNPFSSFKLMQYDEEWSNYERQLHKIIFGT